MTAVTFRAVPVVIVMSAILLLPRFAAAHCDSMDGPVVNAAKLALKTSDVTPVLRWVPLAAEEQIRAAFEQTLNVRVLSPEAREFADNYFFETLVRVHRAGEGEAYTGLKPRGIEIEPGIALADNSLDMGSVDALIDQVKSDAAQGIRQRFTRAQETSKHANDSVEAGRQFVTAYVEFIHYVENIRQALSRPVSQPLQEAEVTKAVQH